MALLRGLVILPLGGWREGKREGVWLGWDGMDGWDGETAAIASVLLLQCTLLLIRQCPGYVVVVDHDIH